MTQEVWTAVDDYLGGLLAPADRALEHALRTSAEAGLPPINVSATQGKLLQILARSIGARNILEIGTLGAYSTIWMARALPAGGKVITLEADAKHADIARKNIAFAGLSELIDLRFGPALETLPKIAAEKLPPFDLVFIDANKSQMPEYFEWASEAHAARQPDLCRQRGAQRQSRRREQRQCRHSRNSPLPGNGVSRAARERHSHANRRREEL